ncbi:MAG: GDCCVxC domain-containing (seleno)protein [Promethearchaeota archaeon]
MKTESSLKCSNCGFVEIMAIPMGSCVIRHQCNKFETMLTPEVGDSCVYCSYGDTRCPTMQK